MIHVSSVVPVSRMVAVSVDDRGNPVSRRENLDLLYLAMQSNALTFTSSETKVIDDFLRWCESIYDSNSTNPIVNGAFVYVNVKNGNSIVFLADYCDYDNRIPFTHSHIAKSSFTSNT